VSAPSSRLTLDKVSALAAIVRETAEAFAAQLREP
jgi:DNA-binding IclR family transcriptional regulator